MATEGNNVEAAAPQTGAKDMNDWDVIWNEDTGKPWAEMNGLEKASTIFIRLFKVAAVGGLLYLFIVSLSIMGSAFKVIAGPTAGEVFRNNEIFDNPIAGLVLGILATVLVQSSSTSTSIIITMTAADLMEVKNAIFMIMGANIGTSVTNTIVSVFQIGDRDQYRRAFAGATVHDCFNFMTVLVLLPIEAATGLLKEISEAIVGDKDYDKGEKHDFLKKITKPLTARIAEVDKKLVEAVAKAEEGPELDELLKKSMFKNKVNTGNNLFLDTPMSDAVGGTIMLVVSLIILSTCLILLVKVLQTLFRGRLAHAMKFILNLEFKSVPFVADYILIVFGMIITILMQSSSVTTSTLTPLVGIGMVKLDKMFCFTVGANIGTTCTGILSALASSKIQTGLKVALAHLFFNLIGTVLWFPIPFIRAIPIGMAKTLGMIACDWKWFPMVYIAVMFGLGPALLLVLSLIHWAVLLVFLVIFVPLLAAALAIFTLRAKSPERLPAWAKKDPVIGGRSILPPALMMSPPAETGFEEAQGKGASTSWALEPFVWGPKWFVVCMLLISIFNAKWADIKFEPRHDNRHHFGIGAYKTCSKAFEADAGWAAVPVDSASCTAHLASCASSWANCSVADENPAWADADGTDEMYWDMMIACTDLCSLADWETACINLGCTGSKHAEQCKNVSESAGQIPASGYEYVTTVGSVPWTEGDKCREPSVLCDNDAAIGHCGNLALVGMLVVFFAQVLLFFRGLAGKAQDKTMLFGVIALDVVAWLLLLASWAHFLATRGADASCITAVPGDHGYVRTNAPFDDIINSGGGYTFYLTVLSWVILTCIIGLLIHRVVTYDVAAKEAS